MTPRAHRLAGLAALALLAGLLAAPATAQDTPAAKPGEKPAGSVFYFGTADPRTTVTFESETTVETIHGVTHKMNGTATLDFEGGTGSASLGIPVESMKTGLDKRDEHMRSETWLDAAKFPDIRLQAKTLKRVKGAEAGKKETWAYEGSVTIHGVTKDIKGEATLHRIPDELGKNLGRGSWVKVKAEFQVALKDFGIKVPEQAAAKVNDTWDIKVDIAGTTEAPKKE